MTYSMQANQQAFPAPRAGVHTGALPTGRLTPHAIPHVVLCQPAGAYETCCNHMPTSMVHPAYRQVCMKSPAPQVNSPGIYHVCSATRQSCILLNFRVGGRGGGGPKMGQQYGLSHIAAACPCMHEYTGPNWHASLDLTHSCIFEHACGLF